MREGHPKSVDTVNYFKLRHHQRDKPSELSAEATQSGPSCCHDLSEGRFVPKVACILNWYAQVWRVLANMILLYQGC